VVFLFRLEEQHSVCSCYIALLLVYSYPELVLVASSMTRLIFGRFIIISLNYGCFLCCHPIQWKKALPAYHDQFLVAPINHHLWRNWLAPSKHESKFDRSLQFVRFSIIWKYFQTFPNKDHVLFSDYFWLLLGCHQTKISRSFYCSNFHALLVILQSTNALLTLNFSARSIHHTWFAHCFDLQINHSNLVIWWLAPFKSITMLHSTCTTWNPSKTMLNFSRKIINFEHFGQNHAQISAKIST